MADSQLFEIILIATVAAVILFRLYTVLGRRTGNERPPEDFSERRAEPAIPRETSVETAHDAGDAAPVAPAPIARPTDAVVSGLFDISLADRSFDKDKFLVGARAAYEMIETAFFAGDRIGLKPLLDAPVYAAFEAAIGAREAAGRKCAFTFIGYRDVKIVGAVLKNTTAEVAVRFDAQFISAVLDAAGTVVEGDEKTVQHVCDVWTFRRDIHARNPNWTLIATASETAP